MNKLTISLFLFGIILGFFSCQKEEPVVENEEEVITTLIYTLTSSSGHTAVFNFQDLDGDGGNSPVVTADTLMANTTYTGVMTLLNESETPAENITTEIQGEALDHQFFFTSSDSTVSVAYTDADTNGNPIGLATTLTTGAATMANLTIVLRHEPAKDAAGVSSGVIDNAGGETDIEVNFHLHVE